MATTINLKLDQNSDFSMVLSVYDSVSGAAFDATGGTVTCDLVDPLGVSISTVVVCTVVDKKVHFKILAADTLTLEAGTKYKYDVLWEKAGSPIETHRIAQGTIKFSAYVTP